MFWYHGTMLDTAHPVPEVIVLPSVDGLCELSDSELVELQRSTGAMRQQVDARLATIAGELSRRSDRALGHDGLAARLGAASPEKAIQSLTGVSFSEARVLAKAGAAAASPWLAPMQAALASGEITVAAVAAISTGLGTPSDDVAADDLMDAASALVEFAAQSTPERTATAARQMREQLDVASVADLEAHRRSKRELKWFVLPDGNVGFKGQCDPESAALLFGPIESVLSPRRGGPRFVDQGSTGVTDPSNDLAHDSRTNDQLALDTLLDICRLAVRAAGTEVDSAKLFGQRSPAVRVHVQAESLRTGTGVAFIEGQAGAVSVPTAQRYICDTGALPIVFDGAVSIDVGKTQRLHSARQRIALAAQWNGCPVGDCDKPASMTEVHHVEPWDGSNTTLANGISLCRFHHLELHANGWSIQIHSDGTHWLVPSPRHPGPLPPPIPLRSRSPYRQ
jgi:hypothetical protein